MKIDRFLFLASDICARSVKEKWRVIGRVRYEVIDSFDGKLWLDSAKIEVVAGGINNSDLRSAIREGMADFRSRLVRIYQKFLPEPEAGLIAGIVLGDKKNISRGFYQEMVESGSVHIAVASGYNILLVGGAVLGVSFFLVRRKVAVWFAILAMVVYALLAGGETPVVRAVWMAGFMYFGQSMGRGGQGWWYLMIAVFVMLLGRPSLVGEVSFQLSVMASLGLVVVEPVIRNRISSLVSGWLETAITGSSFLTTISTMIMTAPIIWWHFGRLSLFGVFSNILILPLIPPLMVLGIGMLVFPGLLALPVYALSHWMVMVIKFFGNV